MKIVATGIIKSGKIVQLKFDPSLLCKMKKAGEGTEKTKAPVASTTEAAPKFYRGKSDLGNQITN